MSPEPVPPAAQNAEVFGRGNVVVQIQGDGNTVIPGVAHLTLTRYLNRRRGGDGPSGEAAEILSPYALAIPFIGRETVMADLWTWMEKDQPISVRVLTARGGGGKTRLALELCDDATRKGWFAGFVTDRELQRFLAQQNLSTWGWNRPTLVVIDYAASRARLLHDWFVELADNAGDSGHPLRLLLLERHADPSMGWWLEAFGKGGGDALAVRCLLDPAEGPYTLPSLTAPERRDVFTVALERTGSALRPPETSDFDHRLAELSWGGEPLFLMMAGLTAARAGLGHVLALSPTDVAFEIAEHELKRIRGIGESHKINPDFMAHMAAYVTLCQGLSRSQAEEAIATEKQMLRYDSAGDPPKVYQALQDALLGDGRSISPVSPDIVGEVLLILALGTGDPEKAEDAVARAWGSNGERVFPVVMRTADDFGSIRKECLGWLARLLREGRENDETISWMADQFPQETLALREIAAELMAGLVKVSRQKEKKELLLLSLNGLAFRLGSLGRQEEALEACREAILVCSDLASGCPKTFRPALAMSLHNLATRLSAIGHPEESLDLSQKAVALYRDLVLLCPEVFYPHLATSLLNLATRLITMGSREEALVACQESVSIHRRLESRSAAFRPILGMSLNNLANLLSEMGHPEEALTACQEAVLIRRELASSRPEAFRSDLAMTLSNLATRLIALRRWEEALKACEEAVHLQRELASMRPEAFRPYLASALHNLAPLLNAAGRQEEALEVCQESLSIRRELAWSRPAIFRPDVAMSLINLSNRLKAMGRLEEALQACEEAVSLYRDLASSRRAAFRPDLAKALYNLSWLLRDVGQKDQALEASCEAVELLTPFFLNTPVAFQEWMMDTAYQYLHLCYERKIQPDTTLLAPLLESGFFGTGDQTSLEESTSNNPEEEPR